MKVRLIKILVQPVCVTDDGKTLTEVNTQPVSVGAEDWDKYSLDEHMKQIKEQVENLADK